MATLTPAAPAAEQAGVEESQVCLPAHAFYAFDTLYCELTGHKPLAPKFSDDKYPLFVTWNTRSSRPGRAPRLRGCIGNFQPMPLHEGLAEYALVSAFRDSRFRKIEERELDTLECGISLLTDFEDASSYLDWTLGTHGIYISFPLPVATASSEAPSPLASSTSISTRSTFGKHTYTATFLPEIATEQGWDKIETVDSAIRKAGWNGRITEDVRRSVKLRRYQSRHCTVSWEEYAQWRKDNGGEM